MIHPGPVTRLLVLPVVARLGLLLLLVVAIFMAESFTNLLEQALRFDGGGLDVIWLMLLKAPEIVDLALALGVLIAVFFAVQEARNRGELVILATSGVRWTRVLGFAFGVGIAGALISVAVSGYVMPRAQYAERLAGARLQSDYVVRQITRPGPRNARQTILDTTFIASPPTSETQERGRLFVYQPGKEGSWRIGQSRDWTVRRTDEAGGHRVILHDLQAYSGAFSATAPQPVSVFRVSDGGMDFDLSEVTGKPDLALRGAERLLSLSSAEPRRLGAVGARALLVPTAALLALAAILLGGRGLTRFLALPGAVVALLFYDVLGRMWIADAVQSLPAALLIPAAVAAYIAPALGFVAWRGEAIMKPLRGAP
ncbi:LptF/LptG family permease [Shimia sp.]|uniref:LptF/LptG family permease n=1 Tax=Shimia sp. TaxID=1954381 RepID=UPI003569A944